MNNPIHQLTELQSGYTMRHLQSGIEINCTEKYVQQWQQRGFEVVYQGPIRLMKEDADEV